MNDEKFIMNNDNGPVITASVPNKKGLKIAGLIALALVVVAGTFGILQYNDNRPKIPKDMTVETTPESVVSVSLKDGVINITPEKSSVRLLRSTLIQNKINTSGDLQTLDMFDNYSYIVYARDEGYSGYEQYISSTVQNLGGFKANDVASALEISDESDIMILEGEDRGQYRYQTLSPLYKEGYLMTGQTTLDDERMAEAEKDVMLDKLKFVNSIKDNIKFNKAVDTKIEKYIDFEGFGKLKLSDLSGLSDRVGMMYSSTYQLFQIFDEEKDATVLFITHMNNGNLSNVPEKLIPVETYKNVYVDFGYRNKADFGYGGFAVMTDNGMYYFKIGECIEKPNEFFAEILNWLGVSENDEFIEHGEKMFLTLDYLRPTLEEEEAKAAEKNNTEGTESGTAENVELPTGGIGGNSGNSSSSNTDGSTDVTKNTDSVN